MFSPEQVQQVEHNLSGLSEWQRKQMGVDQALAKARDPRQQQMGRRMTSIWNAAYGEGGKMTPQPAAPAPAAPAAAPGGGPSAVAKQDGSGSTGGTYEAGTKRAFASPVQPQPPINPLAQEWAGNYVNRPTTPYRAIDPAAPQKVGPVGSPGFDRSGVPQRLQNLQQQQWRWQQFDPQAAASRWANQGRNPYRTYSRDNPDEQDPTLQTPVWKSLPYDVASLFMGAEDEAKYDPAKIQARKLLRGGQWQPGMRVDDLAQGTGWRAIGGLTDWMGITRSPVMDARDLRASQLGSDKFRQLEEAYAAGQLSPEQFQTMVGSPLSKLYMSAPERLQSVADRAVRARSGLGVDALIQKARNWRQRALGDNWEAGLTL
jgi:hypothetical protein